FHDPPPPPHLPPPLPLPALNPSPLSSFFFLFPDPATTETYTLSLHDALPICSGRRPASPSPPSAGSPACPPPAPRPPARRPAPRDRKSTRLNSSHVSISYAVFCLKKKKKIVDFIRLFASNTSTVEGGLGVEL